MLSEVWREKPRGEAARWVASWILSEGYGPSRRIAGNPSSMSRSRAAGAKGRAPAELKNRTQQRATLRNVRGGGPSRPPRNLQDFGRVRLTQWNLWAGGRAVALWAIRPSVKPEVVLDEKKKECEEECLA